MDTCPSSFLIFHCDITSVYCQYVASCELNAGILKEKMAVTRVIAQLAINFSFFSSLCDLSLHGFTFLSYVATHTLSSHPYTVIQPLKRLKT